MKLDLPSCNWWPRSAARFLRSESGSVTFEAVLWLPVFAAVLWLITEATLIFGGEARIYHVVEDANRLFASGYFTTASDTETFIRNQLPDWSSSMTVSVTQSGKIIKTLVSLPVSTLSGLSAISQLSGVSVVIGSEQMSEG